MRASLQSWFRDQSVLVLDGERGYSSVLGNSFINQLSFLLVYELWIFVNFSMNFSFHFFIFRKLVLEWSGAGTRCRNQLCLIDYINYFLELNVEFVRRANANIIFKKIKWKTNISEEYRTRLVSATIRPGKTIFYSLRSVSKM